MSKFRKESSSNPTWVKDIFSELVLLKRCGERCCETAVEAREEGQVDPQLAVQILIACRDILWVCVSESVVQIKYVCVSCG